MQAQPQGPSAHWLASRPVGHLRPTGCKREAVGSVFRDAIATFSFTASAKSGDNTPPPPAPNVLLDPSKSYQVAGVMVEF